MGRWDGLDDDALLSARGVLVTLDDVMLRGAYEFVDGVANDDDTWVSGLSSDNGPILISWNSLAEDIECAGSGRGGDTLDEYAGVNPTEFFAVATESFFDAPEVQRDEHGELYGLFVEYFGIDWAARIDRANADADTAAEPNAESDTEPDTEAGGTTLQR